MPYIYKITNQLNNKIYIGKTIRSISERWNEHTRDYLDKRCENRPLYRAMSKYGIENFSIEQIEECDLKELEEKEKYWIEFYGSFKYGYNATLGGDGKPFIDRELVIKLYNQYGTCKEVAEITGHDSGMIGKILKENNITTRSGGEITTERYGKHVLMCDLKDKPLQTFPSLYKAAAYIKNNFQSTATEAHIATSISRVAQGKRQTAYKYKWKFI